MKIEISVFYFTRITDDIVYSGLLQKTVELENEKEFNNSGLTNIGMNYH